MAAARLNSFEPDYATAPGESLRDTIEAMGMSQAELANRTGLSTKHVNQIVQGIAPVSAETALALERVTGAPAEFWNTLEANHRLHLSREAETAESEGDRGWVAGFPLNELRRRGLVENPRDWKATRAQLLAFFGVANRTAWERVWGQPAASFRQSRSFQIDTYATACWLRLGELEAADVVTEPFNATRFRRALTRIRRHLTSAPKAFESLMREECRRSGVAVALIPEVKGSRAYGAVRWLTPDKAMLQLSLRLKWEDVFWFSFFHEAGHVLLHGKREAFVDYKVGEASEGDEAEADRFAQRWLIPDAEATRLTELGTVADIELFAEELRLPPAIVVGRMHHEKLLPYSAGNHLRRRLRFVEAADGNV